MKPVQAAELSLGPLTRLSSSTPHGFNASVSTASSERVPAEAQKQPKQVVQVRCAVRISLPSLVMGEGQDGG